MKKIPSLFKRDFADPRHPVLLREVTPGCEWVIDGEGVATRKRDGTACAVIGGEIYARYDAKNGKMPPDGAIPCDPAADPVIGHWPHWVLATRPEDKWIREAHNFSVGGCFKLSDGTYEACGPNIGGNNERLHFHMLIRHGAETGWSAYGIPRTFDGLRVFLTDNLIEGLVFHHMDGRMAKIRRDQFGLEWPIKQGK